MPAADPRHVLFRAGGERFALPLEAVREVVTPQPGGCYGGWITADVVGPFKGGPGTWGW